MKIFFISLLLHLYSMTVLSQALNYKNLQGCIVYEINFNNDKISKDGINSIINNLTYKYSIIYNETSSAVTSSSNKEITLTKPFSWNSQLKVRYRSKETIEIWKKVIETTYLIEQSNGLIFKSFTGIKKKILGMDSNECNLITSTGSIVSGWVTKDLPKTAGIELLKGCEMALIVVKYPTNITTIVRVETTSVPWKEVLATRPKTTLYLEKNKLLQRVLKATIITGAAFPTFSIRSTTGKEMDNKTLLHQTTVFFFL